MAVDHDEGGAMKFPDRVYKICFVVIAVLALLPMAVSLVLSPFARLDNGTPTNSDLWAIELGMSYLGFFLAIPLGMIAAIALYIVRSIHNAIWNRSHSSRRRSTSAESMP